jgi:hypothetical protein
MVTKTRRSIDCERRVRKALAKLTKTGAPFTVENVCDLAGVGKTFIYDKRRPELMHIVLTARDASQAAVIRRAEDRRDDDTASWRERAVNAEALATTLREAIKQRDARIVDLTGQLYDPSGTHLAEENTRLRELIKTLSTNMQRAHQEIDSLRRSLDAARAKVKRERERNVTQLFASDGPLRRDGADQKGMTADNVSTDAGMEIGSHTCEHPK